MRVKSWERGQKSLIWGEKSFSHIWRGQNNKEERGMNIQGHDAPKFDPGFLDIQFCYPGSGTPSYFCASFSFLSWCSTKTRMFKVPFECSAKPACFVRQFWVCCVWIQLICSSLRQTCVCFCKKLFDWFWSEKKPEQPLRFDQMWWTELWKTKDLSPNSQRGQLMVHSCLDEGTREPAVRERSLSTGTYL